MCGEFLDTISSRVRGSIDSPVPEVAEQDSALRSAVDHDLEADKREENAGCPKPPIFLLCSLLIGVGATVMMDAWAIVRKRWLGIPPLDYGLVGRWLSYLPRGRFRHDPIAASKPVQGERVIGWVAHYLIGVAFAGVLLAIRGSAGCVIRRSGRR